MARTFTISDEQEKESYQWIEEHEKTCQLHGKYLGAIGGQYTFKFTGTSIGELCNLACACGAETCLTKPRRDI